MTYGRKTCVFFEIDQPLCSLSYGEAPCTAKLGVTGTRKCFNTLATCQDQENFTPGTLTLRFARDDTGLPLQYGPLIACLDDVRTTPARINIGGMEDSSAAFGKRETITVRMRDLKWSDHLVDKYRLERTFVAGPMIPGYAMPAQAVPTFGSRARTIPELDLAVGDFLGYDDPALSPFNRGTFWSRFVARNPYYPAMNCRVLEGEVGQALSEMKVRHYVLERIDGPNDGVVTITATDVFSKIEARKSLAPFTSIGDLSADITGSPGTFGVSTGTGSLTPEEGGYSTITNVVQGYVAIGQKEIIKVTRVGDTFTVVQRGALGTTQVDHKAGDSVQLVLAFVAQLSHDIVYNLIAGYTEVDTALIDKPEWDALAAPVTELFTSYIAEPTPVENLIGELMMQAGFTVWPDVSTGMIRYAALRSGAVSPLVSDQGWVVDGSLSTRRRVDMRVSQTLVYYVKRSPLSEIEDSTSYAARLITPGPGASPYGSESVRKVFSRWITTGGQATARKCGERIFAMYGDPPLEAKFSHDARHAGDLEEAKYFEFQTEEVQDDVGDIKPVAMTPVSIRRGENVEDVEAMSVRFAASSDDPVRRIVIDTDEFDVDLRAIHDLQFSAPVGAEVVEFTIAAGIRIGSTSASSPALTTGSWPGGVTLSLINEGRIQGHAGNGANGTSVINGDGLAGQNGGPAFVATYPISVDNTGGEIWSGGGGGGSSAPEGAGSGGNPVYGSCAGGGGAGTLAGSGGTGGPGSVPGNNGSPGTSEAAGAGGPATVLSGKGGDGGGPGLNGQTADAGFAPGAPGAGGTRGNYVEGNSNVTWTANGDRRGGVA